MTTRCGCCGTSCTSQGEPPARRAGAAPRTVRNTHGAKGCLRDPHPDWELGGLKALQGPLAGSPCCGVCCPALVCPLWVCACVVSPLCAPARVCMCMYVSVPVFKGQGSACCLLDGLPRALGRMCFLVWVSSVSRGVRGSGSPAPGPPHLSPAAQPPLWPPPCTTPA